MLEITHNVNGLDLIIEVDDVEIDTLIEEDEPFLSNYTIGRILLDGDTEGELTGEEYDNIADKLTVDDYFLEKVFLAATDEEN